MAIAVFDVTSTPLRVKNNWLLSLYVVIPACFLFIISDYLFFDLSFRDFYLPTQPSSILFWAIIFNFPHIVSSLITLADKEYFTFYKERIKKALIIIISGVLVVNCVIPAIVPDPHAMTMYMVFFLFFSSYTMWHVLSQQFGIGMMMMRVRPSTQYQSWRLLSTIAGTSMYFLVFGESLLYGKTIFGFPAVQSVNGISALFVLAAVIQGFLLLKHSQQRIGTIYTIANLAMLPSAYFFLCIGYDILVIIIPRFVHDLTAFMIYSVHDQNRNQENQHNIVYRFFSFLPIPPLILCPILAIVVANSIECGAFLLDFSLGFNAHTSSECFLKNSYPQGAENGLPASMKIWLQIMFICGFFHYYLEGFVWKRDAIHRHSVKFG